MKNRICRSWLMHRASNNWQDEYGSHSEYLNSGNWRGSGGPITDSGKTPQSVIDQFIKEKSAEESVVEKWRREQAKKNGMDDATYNWMISPEGKKYLKDIEKQELKRKWKNAAIKAFEDIVNLGNANASKNSYYDESAGYNKYAFQPLVGTTKNDGSKGPSGWHGSGGPIEWNNSEDPNFAAWKKAYNSDYYRGHYKEWRNGGKYDH